MITYDVQFSSTTCYCCTASVEARVIFQKCQYLVPNTNTNVYTRRLYANCVSIDFAGTVQCISVTRK